MSTVCEECAKNLLSAGMTAVARHGTYAPEHVWKAESDSVVATLQSLGSDPTNVLDFDKHLLCRKHVREYVDRAHTAFSRSLENYNRLVELAKQLHV